MKKFRFLFIFILFMFVSCGKVNAATYQVENISTTLQLVPSNQYVNIKWNTEYYNSVPYDSVWFFNPYVEIYENTANEFYPFLSPGQYLVEFIVYGVGDYINFSCQNLSSNFENVNMTTGDWVSDEISSVCIDTYNGTYAGRSAAHILYSFTYKGQEQINELRFNISSNIGFFAGRDDGLTYALSVSPIYDYDINIVNNFKTEKNESVQINQNQTIIDQNKETNDKLGDLDDSIGNMQDSINSSIGNMQDSINSNLDDKFNSCRDSYNLFNANAISNSNIVVSDNGKTITMPLVTSGNGLTTTGKTLKELAPKLKVGDTVYLNFNSTSGYNKFIYISLANVVWYSNSSKVITEDMLNSQLYLYGNRAQSGESEQVIITNFMMSLNSSQTWESYGEICINKLDEQINQNNQAEETRQGIWASIKNIISFLNPLSENFFAYKLIELLVDALIGLFVPEDMSFITDFVDSLENKLGFIAAIPVQIIEFTLNLATATWTEFNSISFPEIEIFGYKFWNAQEIDLTEAINIFKPFKYVTDVVCVVLCARTLNRWRENFTGGGSK